MSFVFARRNHTEFTTSTAMLVAAVIALGSAAFYFTIRRIRALPRGSGSDSPGIR
uniref:hypothetical protein n=1 Tax=Nocardia suismassiliense TaxID=2077092 RepID=UPI003F490BF6